MSIQERMESTGAGRAVISTFIAATLFGMLVWNAPDSHLKGDVLPPVRVFMPLLGLDQNWAVFAPDPRRQVIEIEARLEYADGTTETWRIPNGNAIVGGFEEYRWRKWVEYVRADDRAELWRPAAEYVARNHSHDGRPPVRVTLVRKWYDLAPPGQVTERPPWNEYAYFTLHVTPEMLAEERG